jgi:predicted outer membrane repeat protein
MADGAAEDESDRSMGPASRACGVFVAVLCAAAAAGCIYAPSGVAATFTVNTSSDTVHVGGCSSDPACSLRDAVIAANASAEDDTIEIPAGTYTLTITGCGEIQSQTGDLNIRNSSHTTTIVGAGARSTIVDGGGIDRVFDAETATAMSGITITGGVTVQSGCNGYRGAGIWGSGALGLTDVAVVGNSGPAFGGGIYDSDSGGLTLNRVLVARNSATLNGGGVYMSTGTITNSTIANNTLTDPSGTAGGGIYAFGTVTLANVTVAGNGATDDAGVLGAGLSGSGFFAKETIVADNAPANCDAPVASLAPSNLDDDGTCFGGPADLHSDPFLQALADNGGPTDTMALGAASPAVDAGSDADCAAVDQRGVGRPVGDHCDLGAFEGIVSTGGQGGAGGDASPVFRPFVSRVAPSGGSAGDFVGVDGGGFGRAIQVYFGTTPAAAFVVDADGHLTAVAPAGVDGTVDVRVQTAVGLSEPVEADRFTYAVADGPAPQPRAMICPRVPSFVRHTLRYARHVLRIDGCPRAALDWTGRASRHPARIVLQAPAAGTPLLEGERVTVTVE